MGYNHQTYNNIQSKIIDIVGSAVLCQPVERKSGMQVKRSPDNNALGKQPEEVTVELSRVLAEKN